jgi:preprotein translocase subunit SecE
MADETKICPECAEEVKAAAHVCRFCGYSFMQPEPPGGDAPTQVLPEPPQANGPDEEYGGDSQGADEDRPTGLVVAGYIFAVLLPLVDFILGIVAVTRRNRWASKNGVGIIVLSVVVFIVAVAAITASVNQSVHRSQQQFTEAIHTSEEKAKQEGRETEERINRQSHEAEAKAKQEQAATEAKFKSEQSATEAKAKQEQEVSEAKIKQEQEASEAQLRHETE